jgi:hypothetical protein
MSDGEVRVRTIHLLGSIIKPRMRFEEGIYNPLRASHLLHASLSCHSSERLLPRFLSQGKEQTPATSPSSICLRHRPALVHSPCSSIFPLHSIKVGERTNRICTTALIVCMGDVVTPRCLPRLLTEHNDSLAPPYNRAFTFTFAPATQSAAYRLPSGLSSAVIANAALASYKQLRCAHLRVFCFFSSRHSPQSFIISAAASIQFEYTSTQLYPASSPPAITLPLSTCSVTRSSPSLRLRWLSSPRTVSRLITSTWLEYTLTPSPAVCAPAATVTVTVTECLTEPVKPSWTPPPALSAISTSTLSSGLPVATTTSVILPPPGRPIPTTDLPSTTATTTLIVPSSSGRPGEPAPSSTTVETAGAALATPVVGMGSLVALGAAALAIMA